MEPIIYKEESSLESNTFIAPVATPTSNPSVTMPANKISRSLLTKMAIQSLLESNSRLTSTNQSTTSAGANIHPHLLSAMELMALCLLILPFLPVDVAWRRIRSFRGEKFL